MLAVRRVARPPKMFETGRVVGELPHELHERVLRVRGLRSLRFVPVDWRHGVKVLDTCLSVKGVDTRNPLDGGESGGPWTATPAPCGSTPTRPSSSGASKSGGSGRP